MSLTRFDIGNTSPCTCGAPPCTTSFCALLSSTWCGVCQDHEVTVSFNSGFPSQTASWSGNILSTTVVAGGISVNVAAWFSSSTGTSTIVYMTAPGYFDSSFSTLSLVCDPLSFHVNISGLFPGSASSVLWNNGVTDIYFVGGASFDSSCYPTFEITGCASQKLPGATVNVWNSSSKTTLYGSGTTNSVGKVTIPVSVFNASFYYEVSSDRFATATGTQDGSNPSTSIIFAMSLASGYHCITSGACPFPLPSTLHATFSGAGAQVFTYASGNWSTSFSYLSVNYVINIAPNETMTATADGVGFICTFSLTHCPLNPSFSGTITVPSSGTGSAIGNGIITE